jgi:maleylacetoacetate isomerase/maleylpyruvate isomerase
MKLFGYWRSTAAYRVRIALHLKQVKFENKSVHLIKDGGEQNSVDYQHINPNHLVPTLVDGDFTLNQSLAIIDYLEQTYGGYSLCLSDIKNNAKMKALALDITCEIHPLNNLRVQQYLTNSLDISPKAKAQWLDYWMTIGFKAIETQLKSSAGKFCFADQVTVADICLVAQVYNAKRFHVNLNNYPLINKIVNNCNVLPAFIKALPENQPDAQ